MLSHLLGLCLVGTACLGAPANPPFPRIANCYAVGLAPTSTPEGIAEIAKFDLLIGGVWANWGDEKSRKALADNMAAVRKLNPYIIILDFSSSAPYAYPKDESFPKDGWLLQPDGSRIAGWPGTQMINLTKPSVIDWLVVRSVASVREKGFDGTFIDCMGSGFDWWACNIDGGAKYEVDADGDGKADERAWLDRTWVAAKTELAREVREALGPDAIFMTNQAGEWGLPTMNGILLEDYLDYVLDGNSPWERVLRDYLAWTATPHKPCVTTIVSSSGVQPPFDPWSSLNEAGRTALLEHGRGLKQRMRFGLATTLMGDGYFAYDLHTRWRGQRWWYPEYDAPLGYPRSVAAAQPDGTWRREFDGGTVVVNPTAFDAQMSFADRRSDVSGGKVSQAFVIPRSDGRIFIPTKSPAAPGNIPDPSPLFTMTGPGPVVERGDQILLRMGGLAAILDAQGRLLRVSDGARSLGENLRAFIVTDDQWRDFAYSDCRHRLLPDGSLEFIGTRTDGPARLAFREVVRAAGKTVSVRYEWRALSDVHVHMWRHQLDFPVSVYGAGDCEVAGVHSSLPADRSEKPVLVEKLRSISLRPRQGTAVTVTSSGDAALVDERHYGVEAFRLGYCPAGGDLKAGGEWTWEVRVSAE